MDDSRELPDQKRTQGSIRDLQAGFDSFCVASPHGVFVLHRERAVEAAFVERVDESPPIDVAEAWNSVPPPSGVPRVFADRFAKEAVAVTSICEQLDVLR